MAKPDPSVPPDPMPAYETAANASPDSVEAQTNLGWGLYGKGRYEEAIRQFEKAIGLNGGFLDAYYGLGLACKKAGRGKEAIAAFEKVSNMLLGLEDKARAQLLAHIVQSHLNDLRAYN